MKMKQLSIFSAALVVAFVSSNALANDGTPPWIHELIQSDTNVDITLGIVDSGEPGLGESYRIERDGPEGVVDVVDDETFSAADAVETEDRCRGGWEEIEYCAENPDDCLDCDGDQVLECNTYYDGWCETVYYFEVTDWCVPAGATLYALYEMNETWTLDDQSIEVEAWDGECEPPAGDVDTDTDTDTDSDADDDAEDDGDGGCSVAGPGANGTSGIAALLISLFGAAAFFLSRRSSGV